MDDLRTRLLADAFLYDDPAAYTAGVDAALRATAAEALPPAAIDRPVVVEATPA